MPTWNYTDNYKQTQHFNNYCCLVAAYCARCSSDLLSLLHNIRQDSVDPTQSTLSGGGGLLYCKCHPVARWEDSKQSKTSRDISSCSRMGERVGWNEFNGKCPFLLPVLPGTSPAIDFHIKQTFSLTLFPDVAQSAYRSQWAARHHRCILNHRELN